MVHYIDLLYLDGHERDYSAIEHNIIQKRIKQKGKINS